MSRNLLGNSAMPNYIKIAAVGILGMTYCAALAVATRDYMAGIALPTDVSFILGMGSSLALTILGVHQGTSAAEFPSSQTQQNGGTASASPPTP